MDETGRRLGERIRTLREARNLSQEALAEAAGLHPQSISRYERGVSTPSITIALQLAAALEVDAQAMFGDLVASPPRTGARAELRALAERAPEHQIERIVRLVELFIDGVESRVGGQAVKLAPEQLAMLRLVRRKVGPAVRVGDLVLDHPRVRHGGDVVLEEEHFLLWRSFALVADPDSTI